MSCLSIIIIIEGKFEEASKTIIGSTSFIKCTQAAPFYQKNFFLSLCVSSILPPKQSKAIITFVMGCNTHVTQLSIQTGLICHVLMGKLQIFRKKSRTDCQKSSLRTKAFIHLLPPLTKFLLSMLQKNLQGFSASGFRVWALHIHLKTTTEVILEQFELCTSAKNKWTKNIGSSRSVLTHVLN